MILPISKEELDVLAEHFEHDLVVAFYGSEEDGFLECAIECEDCYETLVSLNTEVEEE